MRLIQLTCAGLFAVARRFVGDRRGNMAMLFAVAAAMIVTGVGAGIDLARAYGARQRLSQTAILACQFASRPSINPSSATYVSKVTSFITATLTQQNFQWTQTNSAPYTYNPAGTSSVTLKASVPTSFMQIVHIATIPISASSTCNPTTGTQSTVVSEGFEATTPSGCSNVCWYLSNGTTSGYTVTGSFPQTNTFTSTVAYTGSTGTQWYIMGYCLEVDLVGAILGTVPQGTHSAELDCDNGHGTAGNSSISTEASLAAGDYEVRYNYAGRIDYPDYDPVYLCGSSASDLSWANDTNAIAGTKTNVLRTNQINVYLDQDSNGQPPTHTTIDGTQTLAGSNLIDMCVYSNGWIQRSVRIKVTTTGNYWLSFAADGSNDSFGGLLDNIMLCRVSCSGSLQDNFPTSWLPVLNVNKVLFEDTFESPLYTANFLTATNTSGNLNYSYGTSGLTSGWPSLAASGWTTAPYNAIQYELSSAAQGRQNISLDMYISSSDNRAVSRGFLLDPGYYQVNYNYVSDATFSSTPIPACSAAPNAATVATYAVSGSATAGVRLYPGNYYTLNYDTNTLGVFMSHALVASTPIGGGALNSQTSYNNPDGTVTTTPKVSPYAVTLSNYSTSGINPLIDICGYAASWQTRTVYIQITKPAYYWLTFAALGTADDIGASIDDVKLTALGSLYMSSPPSTYVSIPVPSPQNGSPVSYTGFYIIADPLTPPALPQ
jgi:Flp pilus assembly protein TadG